MAQNKVTIQFLEVESLKPLEPLSPELQSSLQVLPSNPAFNYLSRRFKRQAALLKERLSAERHASIEDVQFLQSGIFWCRWLDDELHKLLRQPRQSPVEASPADLDALASMQAALQVLV